MKMRILLHKRGENFFGKIGISVQILRADQYHIIFRARLRQIVMRFKALRKSDFAAPNDFVLRVDVNAVFSAYHKNKLDAVMKMKEHPRFRIALAVTVSVKENIIRCIRLFFVKI